MSLLKKNIIYNLVGQGLLLVLGLISVKLIFSRLGGDALGLIFFASTLNLMINEVLGNGLASTTVREVSAFYATDKNYIRDLVKTGSLFFWAGYLILAAAIFFLSPLMVHNWINLEGMAPHNAVTALRILGVASLVALPNAFYASLLRGVQRMDLTNLVTVGTTALQQGGAILILALGRGFFEVIYWFSFCYFLRVIAFLYFSRRMFPASYLLPGYSHSAAKRVWDFASKMTLVSLVGGLYQQGDKVFISKFLPVAVLGYYTVAKSYTGKGGIITTSVAQAAYPAMSETYQKGDRNQTMSLYWKLQDLVTYSILPVFALIPFVSWPVFSYMFDEKISAMLVVPIIILCMTYFLMGSMLIPYFFSLAAGNPDISAKANLYALFLVLPFTPLLVYWFGLVGAALSQLIYPLFTSTYAIPRVCRECLEIPGWRWHRHLLKILAPAGAAYGAAGGYVYFFGPSYLNLGLAYLTATLIYAAVSFFTVGPQLKLAIQNQLAAFGIMNAKEV